MISHIVWDISPEVFDGFQFLRWYGLCWVLGILLGHWVILGIYRSENSRVDELDQLVIYVLVGAVVGARLGHILFYDPIYYLNNPFEILPIKVYPTFEFTGLAGLASHGGVLGAMLALYVYNRKFRKGYLWLLDRLIIGGAVLAGFIRLGNLMNSEIVGTPSNLPWAFVFTSVDQVPRHPSQIYEAAFYLIVAMSLYFVWRSGKFNATPGFIFGLGITLIFTQRFFIEFLKEDQVPFEEMLILNMGQILSIPVVIGGIVLMIWSRRKHGSLPSQTIDRIPRS
jgi:prolipoprotein diacylglyceryl transferase